MSKHGKRPKLETPLNAHKSIYPCDACGGKRTYLSRAAADDAASDFRDRMRQAGPAMRPYRCPVEPRWVGEERWHIGHNPFLRARGLL